MIADIPFKNMAMGEKNVVVTVLVFCLSVFSRIFCGYKLLKLIYYLVFFFPS